jgi:hypothetical protein
LTTGNINTCIGKYGRYGCRVEQNKFRIESNVTRIGNGQTKTFIDEIYGITHESRELETSYSVYCQRVKTYAEFKEFYYENIKDHKFMMFNKDKNKYCTYRYPEKIPSFTFQFNKFKKKSVLYNSKMSLMRRSVYGSEIVYQVKLSLALKNDDGKWDSTGDLAPEIYLAY